MSDHKTCGIIRRKCQIPRRQMSNHKKCLINRRRMIESPGDKRLITRRQMSDREVDVRNVEQWLSSYTAACAHQEPQSPRSPTVHQWRRAVGLSAGNKEASRTRLVVLAAPGRPFNGLHCSPGGARDACVTSHQCSSAGQEAETTPRLRYSRLAPRQTHDSQRGQQRGQGGGGVVLRWWQGVMVVVLGWWQGVMVVVWGSVVLRSKYATSSKEDDGWAWGGQRAIEGVMQDGRTRSVVRVEWNATSATNHDDHEVSY